MSKNVSSQEHSSSVRWVRDIAPSHYVLNIESFSSLTKVLSECGVQSYVSKKFEANGYKWTFSVYPNGDCDSKGHISVFLRIEDTDKLPSGWKIYTDLKFFIFDQKRDKYSIFQDGGVNRFHRLKPECGIPKLVTRDVFNDADNGYLVNNKCAFGVEVIVLDSKFVGEYLSPLVKVDKTFTWRVSNYNSLSSDICYSEEFTACSFRWKLALYPLGEDPKLYGVNLGLFLQLVDPQSTCAGLFVHFMLSIRNQMSGKHKEKQSCRWFRPGSFVTWGWAAFIPLVELQDSSNGFLVNDCVIFESCIKNVSTINNS